MHAFFVHMCVERFRLKNGKHSAMTILTHSADDLPFKNHTLYFPMGSNNFNDFKMHRLPLASTMCSVSASVS